MQWRTKIGIQQWVFLSSGKGYVGKLEIDFVIAVGEDLPPGVMNFCTTGFV